jgi:hypothetical protein
MKMEARAGMTFVRLLIALIWPMHLAAQDAPQIRGLTLPFKTNAAGRFSPATDDAVTLGALSENPTGPWAHTLAMNARMGWMDARVLKPRAKKKEAMRLARPLVEALQILRETSPTNSEDASALRSRIWELEEAAAPIFLEDGGGRLKEVRAIAVRMAETGGAAGSTAREGRLLLGRTAACAGEWGEARRRLREAGATPAAGPPDLELARELLRHGRREDRAAVAEFLESLDHRWATAGDGGGSGRSVAPRERLAEWISALRSGGMIEELEW